MVGEASGQDARVGETRGGLLGAKADLQVEGRKGRDLRALVHSLSEGGQERRPVRTSCGGARGTSGAVVNAAAVAASARALFALSFFTPLPNRW